MFKMNLHTDHRLLRRIIIGVFLLLSLGVAVIPAFQMQNGTLPLAETYQLTPAQAAGLRTYVSEGCMGCHTQQVRNLKMDQVWGKRPSAPSDYFYSKKRLDFWRQSPSILGSERTGPDLTSIGERQPSRTWHLLHLYNPRIVVPQSIMPGYPWLFKEKTTPDADDVILTIPDEFLPYNDVTIVAGQEALALTEYLLGLKQPELPDSSSARFPVQGEAVTSDSGPAANQLDGNALYSQHCAACHQPTGLGLPGAFPPLQGSEIVTDENPEKLIQIIIQGYDEREEYAMMPPLGGVLSNDEIVAIVNHERSSWGNEAATITVDQVALVRQRLGEGQ